MFSHKHALWKLSLGLILTLEDGCGQKAGTNLKEGAQAPRIRRSELRTLRLGCGFSLVEVVMAIGIVSFSMMTILALLPVGLTSLKDATDRDGITQITQQLRSDLDQIPFSSTTASVVTITSLPGETSYYARNGTLLTSAAGAYFKANFAVASPAFPGVTSSIASTSQTVTVTLSYPFNAAVPKTKVFSLLITKQ